MKPKAPKKVKLTKLDKNIIDFILNNTYFHMRLNEKCTDKTEFIAIYIAEIK